MKHCCNLMLHPYSSTMHTRKNLFHDPLWQSFRQSSNFARHSAKCLSSRSTRTTRQRSVPAIHFPGSLPNLQEKTKISDRPEPKWQRDPHGVELLSFLPLLLLGLVRGQSIDYIRNITLNFFTRRTTQLNRCPSLPFSSQHEHSCSSAQHISYIFCVHATLITKVPAFAKCFCVHTRLDFLCNTAFTGSIQTPSFNSLLRVFSCLLLCRCEPFSFWSFWARQGKTGTCLHKETLAATGVPQDVSPVIPAHPHVHHSVGRTDVLSLQGVSTNQMPGR